MKIINKKSNKQSRGFTVVELIVALFVATAFLTTGYQLFSIIIQDGGESSTKAVVSSVAYSRLQDYKSFATIPCTASTPITNAPTTISGTSSATVSVTISCPYINAPNISKILVTINYGSPTQTVGVATYHKPPTLADTDPANWINIGNQVWAKYNLNVGQLVTGATEQTNNPGGNYVEKYCYDDAEAGCSGTDANGIPYGALYQWNEAMNYSTAEKAQGICPAGSHIPSEAEWKTLEMYLGMTEAQYEGDYPRGTNQGTQMKSGGSSGFNAPLAGDRRLEGTFSGRQYTIDSTMWSSSVNGESVWYRYLEQGTTVVHRYYDSKLYGFSVRCLGD